MTDKEKALRYDVIMAERDQDDAYSSDGVDKHMIELYSKRLSSATIALRTFLQQK